MERRRPVTRIRRRRGPAVVVDVFPAARAIVLDGEEFRPEPDRDLFTGATHHAAAPRLADLFAQLPVALLAAAPPDLS